MNLIPTIIQDSVTKQVLMLGYMNDESLAKTKVTGHVWFYSRSKQRLWEKGESSKNYLNVVEIFTDCDNDSYLITAQPAGPTCHTGTTSCFGETVQDSIAKTAAVIAERKVSAPEGSYTKTLFDAGLDRIVNKVAEESGEVIKAATKESDQRLVEEITDVLFHIQVLLTQRGLKWEAVQIEFQKRQK